MALVQATSERVDQSGKRGLDKSARKQRKTLLQGHKTRTGQQGDQSRLKPQIKKSGARESKNAFTGAL